MSLFSRLLDLACGKPPEKDDDGEAGRLGLAINAVLASLVLAALWGLAAGSRDAGLAVGNLMKVPMIVLLSALVALPVGLLTWKLSGGPGRARAVVLAFASGLLAGCLVLGVAAPIVALYYWSSKWGGPILAQASTFIALLVGTVIFVRACMRRDANDTAKRRGRVGLTVLVLLVAQIASIVQLIALASPILPEHTPWNGGVDLVAKGTR